MNVVTPESAGTIARLKAALNAPNIPAREAESCSRLVERLTRPVRVGVFGLSTGGDAWLLGELLGEDVLPKGDDWPTLEVVHGPELVTHATYEDGETSSFQGPATAAVLADDPVFLRIEAPLETLRRMRFLYLATNDAPADQLAALDWAEPRTDIAIWATEFFEQAEIAVWAQAPDRMKNHALLVSTNARQSEAELTQRAGYDFDGVYVVPKGSEDGSLLLRLLTRLEEDIAEARTADLDAAHVFLHRLGHLVPEDLDAAPAATEKAPVKQPAYGFAEDASAKFEPTPASLPTAKAPTAEPSAPAIVPFPKASPEMQEMLSEPILYLKRRARALLEMIEWKAAEEAAEDDDWAKEVLSHCCETTEGLQMRSIDWPEDEACALTLRRTLDEACDVAILLQVEGGTDQAQDAAMMLLQLRGDFERGLAA